MPPYVHRAYQNTHGLIPPLAASPRHLSSPSPEAAIFFPFNVALSKVFLKHIVLVAI
jgi:hypothetical protein